MLPILGVVLLLHNVLGLPRVDPLVDTNLGLIRGLRAPDGDYAMFLGIPYARVDSENPFADAIPYPPFEETFEAYDGTVVCPQMIVGTTTVAGSLDCLQLDVHVPNSANSNNLLPVLVYIHGGAYRTGSKNDYGPKFLIQQDILIVTLNYRLGAYGFMCTDLPEAPGNQGLKDQVLALRWIKENIQAFGGDPNQITISGESAGGGSVDLHLLSQDDLFDKVIAQSPITLHYEVVDIDTSLPLQLAEYLGFETNNTSEAVAFLSTVEPHLLIAAAINGGLTIYRPCIEHEFDGVENYLTESPFNNLPNRIRTMPIMIGFNNNEMAFEQTQPNFLEDNSISSLLQFRFSFSEEELADMERLVRHFYTGDEDLDDNTFQQRVDFASDFTFYYPISRSLRMYSQLGARSLYQYMFAYDGTRNLLKVQRNITAFGAAHADELGYLYDSTILGEPTEQDQLVIDRMTTMWANFVKYGDPTPSTSELLPVRWPPVSEDTQKYVMKIDNELEIIGRPFHDRIAFWELFFRLNANSYNVNNL